MQIEFFKILELTTRPYCSLVYSRTVRAFTPEAPIRLTRSQDKVGSVSMDYELSLSNCFPVPQRS